MFMRQSLRSALLLSALTLAPVAGFADAFSTTGVNLSDDLRINRNEAAVPGGKGWVTGRHLKAGQELTFRRGDTVLNDEPLVIGEDGKFEFAFDLPADAAVGQQPIIVTSKNPDGAGVMMLRVSKMIEPFGQDAFDVTSVALAKGIYQVAANKNGQVFVAASTGRGDDFTSSLMRLDADLKVEQEITPAKDSKGQVLGVYGLGVDDANGTVWAGNTRSDTVTVYKQDDLSVLKTFPEGSVKHPRDVLVDEANGRVYVNAALTPTVHVYDAKTMEEVGTLTFPTSGIGTVFGSMDLKLDAEAGRIYSASRTSNEVAWVDVKTGEGGVFKPEGLLVGSGVAVDAADGRLFAVGQENDSILTLDIKSGDVLANTPVGAGPINVVYDKDSKQVFVASRASGSVGVMAADGTLVANLPAGKLANHVSLDGKGGVYAVSMSGDDEDGKGEIFHIVPKK